MPLIVCPECSKLMSDKAKICQGCGAPNASLSFGSRTKEFAKSAETFVKDADEKYENFLESPSIKTTLQIARDFGLFLAMIIVLILVFCVWRISTPYGQDYYEKYAKSNRKSVSQWCDVKSLSVYDQGWQPSSRPTYRVTTTMGCFGYIDAVNERLGLDVESSYTAAFKDVNDAKQALFKGIDQGCDMTSPFETPSGHGRDGKVVLSYQDGREAFGQDKKAPLMLIAEKHAKHIRRNLQMCAKKAKAWDNFPRISHWMIKIGLPLP